MKKILTIIAVALMALSAASCNLIETDNPKTAPTLNVSKVSLIYPKESNITAKAKVLFNSNDAKTAEVETSCSKNLKIENVETHLLPINENSEVSFDVKTIADLSTGASITVKIKTKAGEGSITLSTENNRLAIATIKIHKSQEGMEFGPKGGEMQIRLDEVRTNVNGVAFSTKEEWITLDGSMIKVPQNYVPENPVNRIGYVYATDKTGGVKDSIKITQAAQLTMKALRQQDSLALVAIYHKMNGPNWEKQSGKFGDPHNWRAIEYWCTDKPLEQWSGIRTHGNSYAHIQYGMGRVTELELDIKGIKGELPEEIGLLTELNTLRIAGKEITGKIPESFKNLTKMWDFKIFDTSVEDELATSNIKYILLQCPDLRYVSMWGNKFYGKIPEWFKNVPLRINTDENNLTGPISDDVLKKIMSTKDWGSFHQRYGWIEGFEPGGPMRKHAIQKYKEWGYYHEDYEE